jgi:hypothetical protein
MNHQHEILPLGELGTTHSGEARELSDVDIDVELASQPLPLVTSAAVPEPAAPAASGSDPTPDRALERWRLIQGNFVDDPRGALADARTLVDDLMQAIVRDFTERREALDRQWAPEQTTSTEQLRVCLQHYRAFLTRILPVLPATSQVDPVNR